MYLLVCEAVDQCLNSSKIPKDLKQEAQDIGCSVKSVVEEENKAVSLFKKVTPEEMMEGQQKDPILELVFQQVTAGEKLKTSVSPN